MYWFTFQRQMGGTLTTVGSIHIEGSGFFRVKAMSQKYTSLCRMESQPVTQWHA